MICLRSLAKSVRCWIARSPRSSVKMYAGCSVLRRYVKHDDAAPPVDSAKPAQSTPLSMSLRPFSISMPRCPSHALMGPPMRVGPRGIEQL
jgi:hypothetical protein